MVQKVAIRKLGIAPSVNKGRPTDQADLLYGQGTTT